MVERIKITLPYYRVSCTAELHGDLAPKTCEAVWSVLPYKGKVRHAKFAGNEIWTNLSITEKLKRVPRENVTLYPVPGDCLYSYFPVAWEGGYRGSREPLCDLAIWYGLDSPVYQPDGHHPMNHFATIVKGLEEFAKAAERLLLEGEKEIVIERL